jgi:GxxExxY protein
MPVQRDPVVGRILGCAISVHRSLGPGLFESVYQDCLAQELLEDNRRVMREVLLPVTYKGFQSQRGFRVDLLLINFNVKRLKDGVKSFLN